MNREKIINTVFYKNPVRYEIDNYKDIVFIIDKRGKKIPITFCSLESIIKIIGKDKTREVVYLLSKCDPNFLKGVDGIDEIKVERI